MLKRTINRSVYVVNVSCLALTVQHFISTLLVWTTTPCGLCEGWMNSTQNIPTMECAV